MAEEQLVVNKNAITLPTVNIDLDQFIPDFNWCIAKVYIETNI